MKIEEIASALESVKWTVKSCRAGDGDDRTWKQCAEDCETIAEMALEQLGLE